MEAQTKICQNCQNNFTIETEDFSFYEKIKVPAPTFCPECRMLRRMSFFNLSKFYKRDCDKCSKKVIALYAEDKPYKMYCNTCWWADDWDGTEYAMDYDENRSFFDQLIELRNRSVFVALESLYPSNVKTEYTNNSSYQKNCFMTMFADYNENCAYSKIIAHTKDSLDCYRIKESEKCYECVGVDKTYNCTWSEDLNACLECSFCRSCYECSNCVGCINLRNKNYCIFNVQYSKEEYFKKLSELKLVFFNEREKFRKEVDVSESNPFKDMNG